MSMMLRPHEIGGGRVMRRFSMGSRTMLAGEPITPEQLAAMPLANMRSLIENRFIAVWPKVTAGGERHIVSSGAGRFDVIEGRKLNTAPLGKNEAEALARGQAGNA